MKCKKCGKRLKENEDFCTICGYYNGRVEDNTGHTKGNLLDDDLDISSENELNINITKDGNTNININTGSDSNSKADGFYYENEAYLEAYIGEDYKQIKKWPFNVWAFLLNWMYLLYRKLYITGIIGLLVSGIFAIFLRKYFIIFFLIIMIILGFVFNYYYVFIAKRKVEKILKRMEGTDNFTLMTIMKEEGGVNAPLALAIYAAFLLVIFFCVVNFKFNRNHNTKYWKENSENRANCSYLIKLAYTDIQNQGAGVFGEPKAATCRINKRTAPEYEIYIKSLYGTRNIYIFYSMENKKIVYRDNTLDLHDLKLLQANTSLTPDQSQRLASLKEIESNYQNIYIKSRKEDELIKNKKNTREKLNYIFEEEEIVR